MPDQTTPEPPLTLASLRRRPSRRATPVGQPDLFAGLFEVSVPPSAPEPERTPPSQSPSVPLLIPPSPPLSAGAWTPPLTLPEPRPPANTPPAATHPDPLPGSFPEPDPTPKALPPGTSSPQTWTVSSLLRHVRGLVEGGFAQVSVEGEISNWRPAGSGHCYFTVKDAGAQLSAVLFRRQASLLRFRPSDGDAVRLHGQLSVYESRGQMQLIVEWMEQVGLGALLAAVQRLKERLRREGLFDRKRPLPPFPHCIGVITSTHGAALRDIVKVCRRRHASVQLLIYPAAVQGPNCPAEIAAGIRWFNAHPDHAEVVLVARGGGSWEDLHGFDHEDVARAIATSVLPVITGIGHATDATVADAAADLCAPTPSAAAELLTAAHHRVGEHLERLTQRLLRAQSYELLRAQGRFTRVGIDGVLRRVEDGLNRRAQRLDELGFRAETALRTQQRLRDARLRTASARLNRQNPTVRLAAVRQRLEALTQRLARTAEQRTARDARRVERCRTRLEAMSPLRVLERGYALVYGPDGHLLRAAADVAAGQDIRARLATGDLRARVLPG